MWSRDDIKTLLQVEPSHLAITFLLYQVGYRMKSNMTGSQTDHIIDLKTHLQILDTHSWTDRRDGKNSVI